MAIRSKKHSDFIFKFLCERNPFGRTEDAAIACKLDSVDIIYNPLAIKRVIGFFYMKSAEELIKTAAWQQLEKISDTTQETFQDILSNSLKLKLRMEIASPVLVVPFQHNNDFSTECWVLNLGNFLLTSQEGSQVLLYR